MIRIVRRNNCKKQKCGQFKRGKRGYRKYFRLDCRRCIKKFASVIWGKTDETTAGK